MKALTITSLAILTLLSFVTADNYEKQGNLLIVNNENVQEILRE